MGWHRWDLLRKRENDHSRLPGGNILHFLASEMQWIDMERAIQSRGKRMIIAHPLRSDHAGLRRALVPDTGRFGPVTGSGIRSGEGSDFAAGKRTTSRRGDTQNGVFIPSAFFSHREAGPSDTNGHETDSPTCPHHESTGIRPHRHQPRHPSITLPPGVLLPSPRSRLEREWERRGEQRPCPPRLLICCGNR